MDQFLPEQINVLSEVLNDPAILASAATGVSSVDVRAFVEKARLFVKTNHAHIGGRSFVVILESNGSPGAALSLANLLATTAQGKPLVVVNSGLRIIRSTAGGTRVGDSEQRTSTSSQVEIVVHGTYMYVIARGHIVAEEDAVQPEKPPPVGIAFYRPITDFGGLLQDHFDQDVCRERSFRYWKDKATRILLAKPDKTEKLFQRALFIWLDRFVTGKIRVVAETREFGQDPTDVLVVTAQGDHIVEVKWLGTNENGTHYDKKRITEGLRQVHQYLTNDPKIIQAHLVLYDARREDEHLDKSDFDATFKHGFCSDPKLMFLPSESASQKAKLDGATNQNLGKRTGKGLTKKKQGRRS